MDMFSFIKECVLKYDYPLAHSMSEEEIADIFKTSNRCFLISWMLKLLDSTYDEVLENSEIDKELLGNIIHELGFCSEKEKLPFMNGGLPVTQQVKIIYNLFKYIIDIKSCNDDDIKHNVSNDDLMALVNTDLNLFPMYGDIKLPKLVETDEKLNLLENENLETEQKSEGSENLQGNLLDNPLFKEEIQEFIQTLKIEFPEIRSAIESVVTNSDMEAHEIIRFKPNAVETIKQCCENLKIIFQFIKDINILEEFEKLDIGLQQENRNNSAYDMVKHLQRKILTTLKYSKSL